MLVPRLTDGVVVLNGFHLNDVDAHLAGEDEEHARRFGWWPQRSTDSTVRRAIERWQASWEDGGPDCALAMRVTPTLELAGGCELRLRPDRLAECSWWVFPARRGRGLGRRMVTLMADFAFSQLGVVRIEALVEPSNSASRALANAVGFVEEGVLRSRVSICGQRTDMVIASLIKPELTLNPDGRGPSPTHRAVTTGA